MMLYSPSQNAFYATGVSVSIPGDAVTISDALYLSVMTDQANGSTIHNVGGLPASLAATPPTPPSNFAAATAAIVAGLAITSTGTPSINGTYACDKVTLAKYLVTLAASGSGPLGYVWACKLVSGAWVNVGSQAHFAAIAGACCMFAGANQDCIDNVPSAPLPLATANIA